MALRTQIILNCTPVINSTKLAPNQIERYTRQLMLPQIGEDGQIKLSQSCVAIVGAGGLGSPLLSYLAAAGIGEIFICDFDTLSLSNLQRQVLYTEAHIGQCKAPLAADWVKAINSEVKVKAYNERITLHRALELFRNVDLIIDACDNLETRYVLDQASEELNIPYLYGAVEQWQGQIALFRYNGSKMGYRNLFPSYNIDNDKRTIPVVGSVVATVGTIMATEAIKALLGCEVQADKYLMLFDALTMSLTKLSFPSIP